MDFIGKCVLTSLSLDVIVDISSFLFNNDIGQFLFRVAVFSIYCCTIYLLNILLGMISQLMLRSFVRCTISNNSRLRFFSTSVADLNDTLIVTKNCVKVFLNMLMVGYWYLSIKHFILWVFREFSY